MLRLSKIVLSVLSWGPLAWTLLSLCAARFGLYSLKNLVIFAAICYVLYGGFILWVLLNSILTWKRLITNKQCLYHISVTAIGLLGAYLSWHYDVFGFAGSYID